MAVKKRKMPKSVKQDLARRKKVAHVEPKKADFSVTVGRKHRSDVIMEFRIGSKLARDLEKITDGTGTLNITEEEFMGALTGRPIKNEVEAEPVAMEHVNILDEAKNIIYGDREEAYGHPRFNLDSIAQFWTVYLQRKFSGSELFIDLELTGEDVAQLMVLLKTARLIHRPNHRDSLTDQAGYAALQARIQDL